YIVLQGVMYKLAFASVRTSVTFPSAILLYLKRNLISIFMPAGGVTSLAFFMGDIEKQNIPRTKIYFASSLYAFIGMLTAGLMALPIFIYGIVEGITGDGEIMALAFLVILIILLFLMYRSVVRKKLLYRIVIRIVPSAEVYIDEIISHTINVRYLIYTIGTSVTIDLVCIGLVYLSMVALGIKASLPFAMMSYVTGIIAINVSPFMKGLGAVEISMSFVLTRLGYTNVEAVTITLLYRFFEFWLPMIVGALSFLLKINKLLMRIIPALLIFGLGIINIISAITPAIAARLHRLEEFIPFDAIAASNYLVLIAGALMLLTAVFMLRGLRSAWWIALILSAASCIGHLTKAIDYEEATVALIIFIILIFSRKEYNIRGNPRLHTIGIWSAVLTIIAVLIYGTIGFYYLDAKQFGINFNMWQSIVYTIRYFVFIGNPGLVPHSHFTRYFLVSISISGFISLAFLFYTILRPYFYREQTSPEEFDKAKQLVTSHGNSALDYFKTYFDKLIFIPENTNGFISYRTAGSFAVALENPVAENPVSMQECITKFDRFCFDNGYITAYYRVPEESLPLYWDLSKKSLFIGQEAIVDLNNFTLSGVRNKALRNAINKVVESGFRSTVNTPPLKDGLMQKIKAVSDEWLRSMQRDEIVFSQGMFIWNEIKNQTVITVENYEERVIAFLNIIPDYAPGEATYDLIRKTDECPHGVLDFLLAELFKYLKSLNYSTVNLGFAPMSGLDDPHTFTEKTMRFAYERIRSFSQFRGLRFFKEKFFPVWKNKYLIYSNDYDLLQIPAALSKVIKPGNE
ncbi:MAG: phosphatidylglycerol lysyltransferase domain-containing protein, partial [Bacteroidota bacterium]|nr:phosphatidylglycerol lysyltransferase domain-containing protein [Bacteroidota bacterium]